MISTNPSEIPFSNISCPVALKQYKMWRDKSTAGLIALSEKEIALQSPLLSCCLNASKAQTCTEIIKHPEIMLSVSCWRTARQMWYRHCCSELLSYMVQWDIWGDFSLFILISIFFFFCHQLLSLKPNFLPGVSTELVIGGTWESESIG